MAELTVHFELEAIGSEPDQYWKLPLTVGETVCLGRAPRSGWTAGWDQLISREHVELLLRDGRLSVTRLGTAKNAVLFDNQELVHFELQPGQSFPNQHQTGTLHRQYGSPGQSRFAIHCKDDLPLSASRCVSTPDRHLSEGI